MNVWDNLILMISKQTVMEDNIGVEKVRVPIYLSIKKSKNTLYVSNSPIYKKGINISTNSNWKIL